MHKNLSITTSKYHSNVIYRDGKVYMALFPGGYATLDGGVNFHYYTQDYLGNNRAVINGSTGAIEQTIAYYPYGAVIADLGTPTKGQPYKRGGKELMTANGLYEYDFGAWYYYSAVPHFTKPDPLCEKRPDLSPYLYCGNNPVNAIDPDGKEMVICNGTEDDYKYICQLFNNLTNNQYIFSFVTNSETNSALMKYEINPNFNSVLNNNENRVNNALIDIINSDQVTKFNVSSSDKVLIGDARTQTVDLSDIKNIGQREAVTSESAFFHEVYEQYWLQSKNKEYTNKNIRQAHNAASMMEEFLLNKSISPERNIIPCNEKNLYENGVIEVPYNNTRGLIDYPNKMYLKYKNGLILP